MLSYINQQVIRGVISTIAGLEKGKTQMKKKKRRKKEEEEKKREF